MIHNRNRYTGCLPGRLRRGGPRRLSTSTLPKAAGVAWSGGVVALKSVDDERQDE